MKNHQYRLLGWVLAAGIMAGCAPSQDAVSAPTPGGNKDSAAGAVIFPDFKVKTLEGQEKALQDYRGQIVILDLFATWCPPCRMTIPVLIDLQKKYPAQLKVIGLSYDQIPPDGLREFVKKMKINYPVFWGSDEIAEYVGLRGIPHMVILDAQGRVARSLVGYHSGKELEAEIQSLFSSVPPAR